MNRSERLALIGRVAERLWQTEEMIFAAELAEAVLDTPEWAGDGYEGDQPFSRCLRYCRAYLSDQVKAGTLVRRTWGSAHYNASGTAVAYGRRYVPETRVTWIENGIECHWPPD